jgi:hypothetical protein
MEHKSWTGLLDKSGWGDGPWMAEPDKEQWEDPGTGYPCLLVRSQTSGALCGYVGVAAGHPWHGRGWSHDDWPGGMPDVHGSLTYAAPCQGDPDGHSICHLAAPGEPEPLWWLGFDCAHAFDVMPKIEATFRQLPSDMPSLGCLHHGDMASYRTAAYVMSECARLARQAAEATDG